jgi:hypothetical protein
MAKRKVILGEHLYWDERGIQRIAQRGAVIDLSEEEIARGEALEAIGPVDAPLTEGPFDPAQLSDEELQAWVGSAKVAEVVSYAGNATIASRLLEAEQNRDGDPRKGVIEGIESVLAKID